MTEQEANCLLKAIATKHNISVKTVRDEILFAMKEAQSNPDPLIQARWAAIPKKGAEVTIEEFLEYAAHWTGSYHL